MKNLFFAVLVLLLTSCGLSSKTTYRLQPDNILCISKDSSRVLVKGNAAHFQARAERKARKEQTTVKN